MVSAHALDAWSAMDPQVQSSAGATAGDNGQSVESSTLRHDRTPDGAVAPTSNPWTFMRTPEHALHTSSGAAEITPGVHPQIFGAYTPVTKELWRKRLRCLGPAPDKGLPELVSKAPEPTSVKYPFTTNAEILEMYRNPWGRMRIGRTLEDLDSMAGNIAFAHSDDGKPDTMPPLLVTAAVERISLLRPLELSADVELSGQVVYTGSSSMDIRLALHQDTSPEPNLVAMFTFVARDPATGKATRVNPLEPATEQEKAWYAERHALAEARKAARKREGQRAQAGRSEVGDVAAGARGDLVATHGDRDAQARALWAQGLLEEAQAMRMMPGLAAGDAVMMDSTRLANTFTCQPQQRNMHGRIFGGFLMRRAYELAFATVHMFAGQRPRFVVVDRVDFRKPVDVGDLVTFESRVLHVRDAMHEGRAGRRSEAFVEVQARVNQPEHVSTFISNRFTLTFEIDHEAPGARAPLKRILPATPQQALLVEAYFRSQEGAE